MPYGDAIDAVMLKRAEDPLRSMINRPRIFVRGVTIKKRLLLSFFARLAFRGVALNWFGPRVYRNVTRYKMTFSKPERQTRKCHTRLDNENSSVKTQSVSQQFDSYCARLPGDRKTIYQRFWSPISKCTTARWKDGLLFGRNHTWRAYF